MAKEKSKSKAEEKVIGGGAKRDRSHGKKSEKWKNYEIKGNTLIRKTKFCPKCGQGVFMAKHEDRYSCGQCGYTEFLKK